MQNRPIFSRIDRTSIDGHYHLDPNDVCLYLDEYTPRAGYQASSCNSKISNLKKTVDKKGRPEYKYKISEIKSYGCCLATAMLLFNHAHAKIEECIFVPVPPSKIKSDRLYDDRLLQILNVFRDSAEHTVTIAELIEQKENRVAAHMAQDQRPTIDDLIKNYTINEDEVFRLGLYPMGRTLVIFDDVITAGCHFKAMQRVLQKHFPENDIIGLFLARTVHNKSNETIPD